MEYIKITSYNGFYETYMLVRGNKEGPYKTYYEDGQLLEIIYYINNKKYGPCMRYYKNGQLLLVCNYINDKKYGPYKTYYGNGQLHENCNYINDKLEGEYIFYYNNGQIREIFNYINDKKECPCKRYDENGQLEICNYTDKNKSGCSFFDDLEFSICVHSKSERKSYYENDQLKKISNYMNDRKENLAICFLFLIIIVL